MITNKVTLGIADLLRMYHAENMGTRQIGEKLDISSRRVHEYVARAHAAGISWPLPEGWGEKELKVAMMATPAKSEATQRPTPNFATMHGELQANPGLTMQDLYAQYRRQFPHGYCYSRFCNAYRAWKHEQQFAQVGSIGVAVGALLATV